MNTRRLVNVTPDQAYSLEDFIAAGEDSAIINYYNFSILQVERTVDDTMEIQFTVDNLVNNYLDVFRDNAVKVKLTDKEKRKYYYNPDLLAYDIYGTVELDYLVMIVNGIIDPKEFNMPELRLIQKSTLVALMSRIYNAENGYLQKNRIENHLVMPEG